MKARYVVLAVAVPVILLMFLAMVMPNSSVQSAPYAAPTPLAIDNVSGYKTETLFSGVITSSTNSAPIEIASFGKADVQYVIDVTDQQTVTITPAYSNDRVNYTSGVALASAQSADTSGLIQYPLFGAYMRIGVTLGMANPVTVTVTSVMKQ